MHYISVKEYAELNGISERTVRRQVARGKHKVKEIPHPSRKDLSAFLILVQKTADTQTADTQTADTQTADTQTADTQTADTPESNATDIELVDSIEELPILADPVPDLRPRAREIPAKYEELVDARLQIVLKAEEMGVNNFYPSFSRGLLCESALEVIGKAPSKRTVYRWVGEYKRDGVMGLCPQHDSQLRGRKVPEAVQNMLLKILLHPNKIAVATAADYVRDHYRVKKMKLNCSYRTMLRWVNDWKAENPEEWTIAREGIKYYRERLSRTVLRDWTLVAVGDVWVSDGHVLELMIIDPRDGKAKKHQLVVWFDAASRMPMGGALNVTENTEVIQLSFRNGVLFAGYTPLVVYTDNGKAYKSKYMAGSKRSADDIETEIQGVFARLGIEVIHSIPYNAKAKIIERWWQDVQNQVESLFPAFTGPHNQAKPANMLRNEKYIQSRFPHEAITLEQFKKVFEYWAIEIYGRRPHPDYPNMTRMEVFNAGSAAIPEERRISPEELNFMLLSIEKKKVGNQGITLNKATYWTEELVKYVGRDLIVRWDFWDVRSILVYDEKDQFICQAPVRMLQDPLVKLRGDDSQSHRALAADLAEIRAIERKAKESTDEILRRVSDATTDMTHHLTAEEIGIIDETPLMPALPKREESIDEKIAKLDYVPAEGENEDDVSAETREQLRSIGIEI